MAMAVAGLGGYGNGMQLMRNESSSESLAAMLGPGLQAARQVGGLEDALAGGVGQKRPFFAVSCDVGPTVEDGPEDGDVDGGDELSPGSQLEKKRRLTLDQVRSLERNFELENKLEPERKMQLAKELGLRPRQVAVWFQNRRARWKTKQLERDYELLAADYERLKADYEHVLGERNHLKAEVQRLSGASTPALEPAQPGLPRPHNARAPTVDVSSACAHYKETSSGCTDGSNSSDIVDADSPRTVDSSSPSTASAMSDHDRSDELVVHSSPELFPPESSFMVPDVLPDVIGAGVKLEDGFHEVDQSCNYLLLLLDDPQSVLPWWDWP